MQYKDRTGKKKFRHPHGGPILTQVEFIKEQFAKAKRGDD